MPIGNNPFAALEAILGSGQRQPQMPQPGAPPVLPNLFEAAGIPTRLPAVTPTIPNPFDALQQPQPEPLQTNAMANLFQTQPGTPPDEMRSELKRLGYSDAVIAGVLANVQHESSWDPRGSGDSGTAHGYFQHREGRVKNFQKVMGVHPSAATPAQAARFMDWEMRNPEQAGMTPQQVQQIRNARTPAEAAMLFQQFYERPKVVDPARAQTAMGLVGQTMDALGDMSGLPTGYDPSAYKSASAMINRAQEFALQPTDQTFARAPMPEAPTPFDAPTADFAAQDQLIADMAPRAFSEEESTALKRRRLWQGAAQALAGLDEDAHVGSILAKVGAGMLGGRLAADDEIQARIDAYDQKMLEYNQVKYGHEGRKAEAKLAEANAEAMAGYQIAQQKWQYAVQDWNQNNSIDFSNGQFIIKSVTPDGQINVQTRPFEPFIRAQTAMEQARLQTHMGDVSNQESMGVAAGIRSAVLGVSSNITQTGMMQEFIEQSVDPASAMISGSVDQAGAAIKYGLGPQLMPDYADGVSETWDTVQQRAKEQAMQEGYGAGSEDFAERVQQILIGNLTVDLLGNGPQSDFLRQRMGEMSPALLGLNQADVKRQIRTDRRGTTVTETVNP